eukprot:TRINITY_DN2661_c1_g1_i3.p1 TRINITY_DN2661_c1_g1~~TRINITY_DN2661_c1_g1_i3.p1  ORF type:complete len:195 (-),score=68.82 TRINITY_DN2661_c1_g1_i3:80-664(-)
MLVHAVNQTDVAHMGLDDVIATIKAAGRPLRLTFLLEDATARVHDSGRSEAQVVMDACQLQVENLREEVQRCRDTHEVEQLRAELEQHSLRRAEAAKSSSEELECLQRQLKEEQRGREDDAALAAETARELHQQGIQKRALEAQLQQVQAELARSQAEVITAQRDLGIARVEAEQQAAAQGLSLIHISEPTRPY